jgi:ankyrin repeat protein
MSDMNDANMNDAFTPLRAASRRGHETVVSKLLVAFPADVNKTDKNGWTPLHHACDKGHTSIVAMLLASGNGACTLDKFGRSALYYASANGHAESVTILLAALSGDLKSASRDDDLCAEWTSANNDGNAIVDVARRSLSTTSPTRGGSSWTNRWLSALDDDDCPVETECKQ